MSRDRRRRLCGQGVSWTWKDLCRQTGAGERGQSWAGFWPILCVFLLSYLLLSLFPWSLPVKPLIFSDIANDFVF